MQHNKIDQQGKTYFQCNECTRSFSDEGSVRKHVTIVHEMLI